jgi:hypothetical protein
LRALASSKPYDRDAADILKRELSRDLLVEIMGEDWLMPKLIETMQKATDPVARKFYLLSIQSMLSVHQNQTAQAFLLQLSNDPNEDSDIKSLARNMAGSKPGIRQVPKQLKEQDPSGTKPSLLQDEQGRWIVVEPNRRP